MCSQKSVFPHQLAHMVRAKFRQKIILSVSMHPKHSLILITVSGIVYCFLTKRFI